MVRPSMGKPFRLKLSAVLSTSLAVSVPVMVASSSLKACAVVNVATGESLTAVMLTVLDAFTVTVPSLTV